MDKNIKLKVGTSKLWHALNVEQVLNYFDVKADFGLTVEEVQKHLEVAGKNELPHKNLNPWWRMLLRQFTSPLVYILVLAAVLTAWLGEYIDTSVIMLVVAVNTLIGFAQEYQSNKTLEQLKKIVRVSALVLRGGTVHEVDASELVPGDIILLKTGQKVPADVRILEAQELTIGEALLTGESNPVQKHIKPALEGAALGDRTSMGYMGTVVESGRGRALVVATGLNTELGKIAELTEEADNEATPLQQRLAKLAKIISVFVVGAAVIILVVGAQGFLSFIDAFKTAVAVAVAAIPEGLLAALSVVLAVSTKRILGKHGLVRRPVAAETLGSTTVIVADKTGTLTEGEMRVEHAYFEGTKQQALLALALANEAETEAVEGKINVLGESTDRAKLLHVINNGISPKELDDNFETIALLPFDQHSKLIARFVKSRLRSNEVQAYVTGAPEMLLRSSATIGEYEPMSSEDSQRILKEVEKLAAEGYRIIGLADKKIIEPVNPDNSASLKATLYELNFRGLVALRDPIREDVKQTLIETRQAGVRVIMATGDHKLTARAIATELGFVSSDENILSGQEIEEISDDELRAAVKNVTVCYRVSPEHKLRVINALLLNGESVAMTGDGVNDAPALKAADIGIAVAGATDVTKEAADLVLLKNGLSTITDAIREGRIAFDNIRKVTTFLLSGTFTAFIFIMASFILGTPLPLTAVMILWANLVENGLPTFGLAFEKGESDIMLRKPEPRNSPVLNQEAKIIIFVVSLLRDALLLSVFIWYYYFGNYPIEYIQTLVFGIISIDSLFYIYSIKSFRQPIWKEKFLDNQYLLTSVGVGLVLAIGAIYLPLLNTFLGTVPLGLSEISLIFAIVVVEIVLYELVKLRYRTKIA
jgi:Ca2+-transporting ATPase